MPIYLYIPHCKKWCSPVPMFFVICVVVPNEAGKNVVSLQENTITLPNYSL